MKKTLSNETPAQIESLILVSLKKAREFDEHLVKAMNGEVAFGSGEFAYLEGMLSDEIDHAEGVTPKDDIRDRRVAANDACFEWHPLSLMFGGPAEDAPPNHGTIKHIVNDVTYGEIELIQCGDEIDIIYRLEPEHMKAYGDCSVRIRFAGAEYSLGRLDGEGKATLTVKQDALPHNFDCQLVCQEDTGEK